MCVCVCVCARVCVFIYISSCFCLLFILFSCLYPVKVQVRSPGNTHVSSLNNVSKPLVVLLLFYFFVNAREGLLTLHLPIGHLK